MIILSHPTGNSTARQTLKALKDAGLLKRFVTSLAFTDDDWIFNMPWPRPVHAELKRRCYNIDRAQLCSKKSREALRLLSQKLQWNTLIRHEQGPFCIDKIYRHIDKTVYCQLKDDWSASVQGVYAYEDGALQTFRIAREREVTTFYELPIAYYATARRILDEEAERLPEWASTLVGTEDSPEKLSRKAQEADLADVIICPSKFVYDSLPETIRQSRVCAILPYGAPVVRKAPERLTLSNKIRFLFVGSLTQRKGIADLLEAFRVLNRNDIELIVLGSPVQPLSFYQSHFPGMIYEPPRPHDQVLALMRTCDVLVLPSLVEGRALVQLEALSSGLPLIITPNTGGEDLVIEGQTGFVVPIRSPKVLAEKIAWCADNPNILRDMQESARSHASTVSWDTFRKGTVDLIKECINKSKSLKQSV